MNASCELAAVYGARLRKRLARDDGTTLIELMVGMIIMAIFLSMATGAMLMMSSAMNKSQAINLSSSQLNVAFQNLDNTVRYASAISSPGSTSSGWYVEFRSIFKGDPESCTQLRVGTTSQHLLERRTWTVTAGVASDLNPPFMPISSGITNGAAASGIATQPFYLLPPHDNALPQDTLPANALSQQLRVTLTLDAGPASSVTTSKNTYTFTALNSSLPVSTSPICQEVSRP